MSEYKCINCGKIRESNRISSCPDCGYKMFEMPYERKEVLISEMEGFVSRLEIKTISRSDLIFENMDKNRFPDYEKILKYVSSRERTEDFIANLQETVQQLKMHYSNQFSDTYVVSFKKVEEKISRYDSVLYEAVKVIAPDTEFVLDAAAFDNVSVVYSETPNKYLWFSASELLDDIKKLADKIVSFIKVNNLYGSHHKFTPKQNNEAYPEDFDYKEELENAILKTEKILSIKYTVDIMDDGDDEIKEMLTCLWKDIELIMSSPLFIENYSYITEAGPQEEKVFLEETGHKLSERYEKIDKTVHTALRDSAVGEDVLFDFYNEYIKMDTFGFIMPSGAKLIPSGESEKKLNELIGLKDIKESIQKIKSYMIANKDSNDLNIHMCFMGNPGSGKTEVARIIAGILYENKILPTKNIVEVDRSGLVSEYFGATAEKTRRVIERSMGGVLFIDEAYALFNETNTSVNDYGKEAIDTLVKAMEDYRGKFCVILAGYKNEMNNMLSVNPGFRSRIPFILDFPNYSREELGSIAQIMLNKRNYTISEEGMNRILDITDIRRKDPNFANAREIRNILDQVVMCQNMRCMSSEDKEIGIIDVNKYIADSKIILPIGSSAGKTTMLTGEEELDQLVGLDGVKRMIKKIKAYAKRNKDEAGFNLHMCFYGNPGTGKTEVARIISRLLYDAGVLGEAKLVETDGNGLIGKYVGETAPKTEAKINEAMNGVLFIDEAYTMTSGSNPNSYGEEAIAALLKGMEDHRGQFCTILAGYKDEMKSMISANPGFESRIQFTLDFPDYSKVELGEIADIFLKKKGYEIDKDALNRILDITEYFRQRPNFANARTVRNILDQIIMNQNLRTEDNDDDRRILIDDVEDYILDENIDFNNKQTRTIGFQG